MYESFYGLKEKPFSMLPDPGFLYLSKKHQMALTLLEYGLLNQAGFCVVSGETGSGKTTLLRKLLENIESDVTVGMITNTHKGFGGLLDWVLSAFNIHERGMSEVEMHQRFLDFLLEQYAKNKTTLLIVDEAQNITADKLEELRMLSNVNSEKDQVLQVILAGQPELKETLQLPELRQFAQRIGVDHHLGRLNEEETFGYINHRLSVAGASRDIFTEEACDQIHEYSGGTPRLINLLCDTVMVYGFADQRETIDAGLVNEMVEERMQDSIVPLATKSPSKKKKIKKKKAKSKPTLKAVESVVEPKAEEDKKKKKEKVKKVELVEDPPLKEVKAEDSEKLEQKGAQAALSGFAGKVAVYGEGIEFNEEEMSFDGSVKSRTEIEEEVAEEEQQAQAEDVDEEESEVRGDAEVEIKAEKTVETETEELATGQDYGDIKIRGPNVIEVLKPDVKPEIQVDKKKWMGAAVAALVVSVIIFMIGTSGSDDAIESVATTSVQPAEVVNEVPDNIKRQLEEAERARQELALRQKEDQKRMKLLEAASARMKLERDEARAKVAAEKKRREKEAELAKAAVEKEKAAKAATQRAVAAALAAERKNNQLLKLRAEDADRMERELLEQRRQQRAELKSVKEQRSVQVEAEVAKPVVEVKKEESFKTDPCASSTARFLSTCR